MCSVRLPNPSEIVPPNKRSEVSASAMPPARPESMHTKLVRTTSRLIRFRGWGGR